MKDFIPAVRIILGAAMTQKSIILYVEDNNDNRNLVRRVLEAEGYTMAEASNAEEAMEKIHTVKPDLILMDINMPGTDGYALTHRIKQTSGFASVPIVAVTANVMRGDRERSLEAGCDGYIQKPIDIDTLTQQIGRFLTRQSND
jgi:two-component system cell cycle response regulator DivK